MLPYSTLTWLGRLLGLTLYRFGSSRTQIARINIQRCFPDLSSEQTEALLKANLISTGIGIFETAMLWFGPSRNWDRLVEFNNIEHLQQFILKGQGVLLLSFHLTHLEIGGSLLGTQIPLAAMYRRNENDVIEHAMTKGRSKFVTPIPREATREMVKHIKKGGVVWYAADQDYGRKLSIFVPFFGISTATITATSRFVKLTKAPVVPMTQKRDLKRGKIVVTLHPPLNISGSDAKHDAVLINRFLENYLKSGHTEDYLWVHRRFKTRPNETDPTFYPKKTWGRPVTPQRYKDILEAADAIDYEKLLDGEQRPKKIYNKGHLIYFIYKQGVLDNLAKRTELFIERNQVEQIDGNEYRYRGLKRKCAHKNAMLVYLENIE